MTNNHVSLLRHERKPFVTILIEKYVIEIRDSVARIETKLATEPPRGRI